ncbi:sulfotransferase family 2 domain-containing protein [Pseudodesulfovibrio piezophilus]|uniref:Putative capsular polysaccharide biosynthesis protein n=1 Tax=Pseudodesulfovibrio piezophilus (strain DSM 21447 / JCM 15486 / C1TLV30) TaxID=1322246 RepID=M1WTF1_PSEP2|nr:sulfotransferase family 2 domain-containing protein [Pseudodesulfovibrio piezophilus]CCH49517.1 putative capsular polysaccharide biosynthesis protein [Pseudodesulfovibrio piezophilus C1TLV30]
MINGNTMQQPLFFLHIPKTAGTTFNAILNDNFAPESIFDLYTDTQQERLRQTTYAEIARYKLVRGHVFITDFAEILDGPVRFRPFTFLRDPVERVVSEYFFLKSWPKSHMYRFLNDNKISLVEYVTSDQPELRMRGRNGMVNSLSGVGLSSIEEGVEKAWFHLCERFVGFGLLERFDESILVLSKVLGLERSFYERHNVRAHGARRSVSTAEEEVIREANQADIILYERACQEFEKRVNEQGRSFDTEVRQFRKINEKLQRISGLIMERDGVHQGDFVNGK